MVVKNNHLFQKRRGYTVAELLIVIVIIGILAALVIVAYNGIQHSAMVATVKANLKQSNTQLGVARVQTGQYPDDLGDLNDGQGLTFPMNDVTFYYTPHNDQTPKNYCLTVVVNNEAFKVTRLTAPSEGYCSEQVPSGQEAIVSMVTNSSSQITVSWSDVIGADNYHLEYSSSSSFDEPTSIEGLQDTSQILSDLASGTTYYARIYPSNALGEGEASNVAQATTDALLPEGSPTISATTDSSTQITVSWSAVTNATHYRLEYSQNSNLSSPVVLDNLIDTSFAVTGLAQGVRYYFRLYAVSEGGDSPQSNIVNAVTPISKPDSPSVSVSIPGSARAYNSGVWAKNYKGQPASGSWYYARASISSSTCASGTTRQWRARVQYNAPTSWGSWTGWTTSSYIYAVQPSSGYGIRYQAQTRCYTSAATSSASSSSYGCRWKSTNSSSCSGF